MAFCLLHDKNLAVLTANQVDRTRKTTVSLIVGGWFALRGRGFLRQYIPSPRARRR